jgi:hypothetical protein
MLSGPRLGYAVGGMRYTISIGLVVGTVALLAGCVTPQNDRITQGRTVRVETLVPSPLRPAGPDIAVPVGSLLPQEPSVVALDRGNWETTVFRLPVDGTAHRLTYAKRLHVASRTARQRGEYPNAETALQLSGGSIWQQHAELANHAGAAVDLLLLLPRMVWAQPWRVRWSPDVAWERTWEPDRPLFPEPVEPLLEDPFAAPAPHPVTPDGTM